MDYIRDPRAIYAESFATVQRETDLARFDADAKSLAIRLIHACGMVDIANDLVVSSDCVSAGRQALDSGAPVLVDATMVAHGIIRRGRAEATRVICTINDPGVPDRAREISNTRSAAAVDLWQNEIEGAVVAIGNAPTALFRLIEHLQAGWPRPAAILAFPVGFVGAEESKQALIDAELALPFATLQGRRGGSAIAAAGVNALALGLDGDGR